VIEFNIQPVIRIVATGTGIAKEVLMHVVFEVAVHTVVGCIAMFRCWRVTAAAVGFVVFTDQFEVGKQVIEACLDQMQYVGITTFMIGMAGGASFSRNVIGFSMEALVVLNVLRDIFMAVATQAILSRAVKRNVAGRTAGLEIRVPANEFAGHDQRLNSLSVSGNTCETSKHYNKSRQSVSSKNHLVHMYSQHVQQG
jgi:hypothetical protein